MLGKIIISTLLTWIAVALIFILGFIFVRQCHASDTFYGIGIYEGAQWHQSPIGHVSQDYDWKEFQLRPIYGKHISDRWDLWLEGKLGYLRWNVGNSFNAGILVMTSYDIVKYKEIDIFGEVGIGLGYNSYTPSTNTLGTNPTGLIDAGVGLEYKNIRIGPRFHHTSSFFGHDAGINTFGILLTFRR